MTPIADRSTLRLALPKGRMQDEVFSLLADAGIRLRAGLGVRLSKKGLHEEALSWVSRALERDPGLAPAWRGMGIAFGKLGRYDEEIRGCDQALEIDPTSVDTWLARGFALGRTGGFKEKIECCDRALSINPDSSEAWNMKGQALATFNALESIMKNDELPVNVKFLLEGEEEIGSKNLEPFLKKHADKFKRMFP